MGTPTSSTSSRAEKHAAKPSQQQHHISYLSLLPVFFSAAHAPPHIFQSRRKVPLRVRHSGADYEYCTHIGASSSQQLTMAPRAVLLVLAALALAQVAHGTEWEPCGPQQYFTTSKVDVLPDPPTTGEDLTFKITGQTAMEVKGGIINIDIGYLGMHIFSEVKNLCDKTQCPIAPNQDLELTYV